MANFQQCKCSNLTLPLHKIKVGSYSEEAEQERKVLKIRLPRHTEDLQNKLRKTS